MLDQIFMGLTVGIPVYLVVSIVTYFIVNARSKINSFRDIQFQTVGHLFLRAYNLFKCNHLEIPVSHLPYTVKYCLLQTKVLTIRQHMHAN